MVGLKILSGASGIATRCRGEVFLFLKKNEEVEG